MSQISVGFNCIVDREIALPASKSISNRALVICALSGERTKLENISTCDDSCVVVRALEQLSDNTAGSTIDIGAAGTAMRFLTSMLCVTPGENVITGTERMCHRPIGILVDALRQLGAEIEYLREDGFPPLRIRGHEMEGGEISLSGDVSSQYISALLMVGPCMNKGLKLHLSGKVVSRPYIEMTIAMMRQFGADVIMPEEDLITVAPCTYRPVAYYIENDWSAASYWYETVALMPLHQEREKSKKTGIILPGLFKESLQGDSMVAEFFKPLGVETEYTTSVEGIEMVVLHKKEVTDRESIYELDLVSQPDLAQTLVATCCALCRRFRFTGLENLRIKETDRLKAMQAEMRKLGYLIDIDGAGTLQWNGEKSEPTGEPIETYEDHRMAMSLAPLAMRCGTLKMNNPEVVSKSYPTFWQDIKAVGFALKNEEKNE